MLKPAMIAAVAIRPSAATRRLRWPNILFPDTFIAELAACAFAPFQQVDPDQFRNVRDIKMWI
jgi:hypothetical protein